MTPSNLRAICEELDRCERGGKARLAKRLGWHHSTLWRKLNGKSRITQSDELAITGALGNNPSGFANNSTAGIPCKEET